MAHFGREFDKAMFLNICIFPNIKHVFFYTNYQASVLPNVFCFLGSVC